MKERSDDGQDGENDESELCPERGRHFDVNRHIRRPSRRNAVEELELAGADPPIAADRSHSDEPPRALEPVGPAGLQTWLAHGGRLPERREALPIVGHLDDEPIVVVALDVGGRDRRHLAKVEQRIGPLVLEEGHRARVPGRPVELPSPVGQMRGAPNPDALHRVAQGDLLIGAPPTAPRRQQQQPYKAKPDFAHCRRSCSSV